MILDAKQRTAWLSIFLTRDTVVPCVRGWDGKSSQGCPPCTGYADGRPAGARMDDTVRERETGVSSGEERSQRVDGGCVGEDGPVHVGEGGRGCDVRAETLRICAETPESSVRRRCCRGEARVRQMSAVWQEERHGLRWCREGQKTTRRWCNVCDARCE